MIIGNVKSSTLADNLKIMNFFLTNVKTDLDKLTIKDCKRFETPVAAFSASPTSGNAPLKITFTDRSTGSPTARKWNFEIEHLQQSSILYNILISRKIYRQLNSN